MAIGMQIERRGHIVGFREEIDRVSERSKDDFFTWFSTAENADASFIRGQWDFMVHIGLPLSKYISRPEAKVSMEIGHGGGRILLAACRSFNKAIGIDIHDHNELVGKELKRRGVSNFELFKSDGLEIPVEDNSIDVIYSFIVLQHVEKIKIFESYFKESYRILRTGGIGILYFGRKHLLSVNRSSRILYLFDCLLEKVLLKNGFREVPERVNYTNLIVSPSFAKRLALDAGFQVLKKVVSHKNVPDGISLYGGQHGLILKKD